MCSLISGSLITVRLIYIHVCSVIFRFFVIINFFYESSSEGFLALNIFCIQAAWNERLKRANRLNLKDSKFDRRHITKVQPEISIVFIR